MIPAEFLWTLAVAVVGVTAGYILCALLVQDKITNTKRIAVKHYRATQRAEAAIARVRQVLDEEQRGYNPPLGLISRIKTALEGDD